MVSELQGKLLVTVRDNDEGSEIIVSEMYKHKKEIAYTVPVTKDSGD